MRRNLRFAFVVCSLGVASLVSSCSSETSAPVVTAATRDFQTDSTHYTLVHLYIYVANIGILFTNRTLQPVMFASCSGSVASFHLEKLVDAAWVRPSSPTFAACGTSSAVLVPVAGQYSTSFKLTTPFPGTFGVPDYTPSDIAGTYRIVWDGDQIGDASPPDNRISNTFSLSVSP